MPVGHGKPDGQGRTTRPPIGTVVDETLCTHESFCRGSIFRSRIFRRDVRDLLLAVESSPYLRGMSIHRHPVMRTKRIPFMIKRLSARGLPSLGCRLSPQSWRAFDFSMTR